MHARMHSHTFENSAQCTENLNGITCNCTYIYILFKTHRVHTHALYIAYLHYLHWAERESQFVQGSEWELEQQLQ